VSTTTIAPPEITHSNPLSQIADVARNAFGDQNPESALLLKRLLRSVAARLVALLIQPYQDPVEDLLDELRAVSPQVARFVDGDYSKQPAFYLGQIHALAELASLVRHQALPREVVQVLGRSDLAGQVLRAVIETRSISPTDLANRLNREPQNLVPINEQLVGAGLLRRDEFGRRVRFSPTALALSAAEQFGIEREAKKLPLSTFESKQEHEVSLPESEAMVDSLVTVAVARGADSIEMKPNEQTVVLGVSADNKKSEHHLPKAAQEVLIHGLSKNPRVQIAKKVGRKRRSLGKARKPSIRYTLSTSIAQHGRQMKVQLQKNALLGMSKEKSMRSSFQKLQTARKNLEAMQRLVVNEAVTDCKGIKTNAARMLGINLGKLNQLVQPR
jgi:DNA-binding MarR family transcriptional regulator